MFRIGKLAVGVAFATCAVLGAINFSTPSYASIIIVDSADFTFTENPGYYTITNSSTDWYIRGLAVGTPIDGTASTTQPAWTASVETIPNLVNGPTYANLYLANNYLDLVDDIGPNQSSSLFFFGGAEASSPSLYLVNSFGQETTITPTGTPLPSTWTMLIAGFVGFGFFAYRGSKKNAAAIAAA